MPLINNDKLGRRVVRVGLILGIGGAVLAILAALGLLVTVVFFG